MRIIYNTILLLFSLSIIGQKQAKIKYNYSTYKSKEVKENGKIEIKKISNDIENALNEISFELKYDGEISLFETENKMETDYKSTTHELIISMLPKTYIDFNNK